MSGQPRFLIAAAFVLIPTFCAEAGPACGDFVLVGGEKVVNIVDHAPKGKSSGDERVGWRALADEAGNQIGSANFVVTMIRAGIEGTGDLVAGQYFITFQDGWLAAATIYEVQDVTDTGQQAFPAVLVVTGGTGIYAGATGTIEIEAGEAPRYAFDLRCP